MGFGGSGRDAALDWIGSVIGVSSSWSKGGDMG
jgi:hypothetical protein